MPDSQRLSDVNACWLVVGLAALTRESELTAIDWILVYDLIRLERVRVAKDARIARREDQDEQLRPQTTWRGIT